MPIVNLQSTYMSLGRCCEIGWWDNCLLSDFCHGDQRFIEIQGYNGGLYINVLTYVHTLMHTYMHICMHTYMSMQPLLGAGGE